MLIKTRKVIKAMFYFCEIILGGVYIAKKELTIFRGLIYPLEVSNG